MVWECEAFSPCVTSSKDFKARLTAEMFGDVGTILLRRCATASGDSEHVSASMRRQAREKQGKSVFPLIFLCILCAWLMAQKCMCAYFMWLEYMCIVV